MRKISIAALPFLLSSCNIADSIGTGGIVALFIVLLLALGAMLFYLAKSKKKAQNTASQFSYSIKKMLDKIGDPKNKIKELDKLIVRINADPKYKKNPSWRSTVLSKVYQHKASIYYQMGDQKKIVEACTAVIGVEPSHMMSYYNRGTIYSNWGQYQKAIDDFTAAISLDAKYADAYNNRGFAYSQKGDVEKGIADLDYSIFLQPTAISYFNRGQAYSKTQDLNKAMDDYRTALSIASDDDLKCAVEVAIKKIEQ